MKHGSVLVFLLMLMFLTMVSALGIWRSTAFMHDVAIERGYYVQKTSELEGLLQLGIAWCEDNAATLFMQPKDTRIVLPVIAWPPDNSSQQGTIEYVVSSLHILVCAHLLTQSGSMKTASCRINAKKRSKGEKSQFHVDRYCLG